MINHKKLSHVGAPTVARGRRLVLLLLLGLITLTGCHRVVIGKDRSVGARIEERQDFYVLGLIGEHDIDLVKRCPRGVASFGDIVSPLDLLFTFGTLGIYAPRTVVVECAR